MSHGRTWRRRQGIRLAWWMRWLHIYLSVFSLAAILFFSVTGITLNHPDWFYAGVERRVEGDGDIDLKWVKSEPVLKLAVVEHLRGKHGVRGGLAEFRVDEGECTVAFKGPGYDADVFINRETGKYTYSETSHGFLAVINDLHKGRDTGRAWSLVIDVSAVLMTVVSLTGLGLLFYLKIRRVPGLVVMGVGGVVVGVVYWWGVG